MYPKLQLIGKEWFDIQNGNSYCSVRIYGDGILIKALPYTYGNGNYYQQYAMEYLCTQHDDVTIYDNPRAVFSEMKLVKSCLKSDVKAWGEPKDIDCA